VIDSVLKLQKEQAQMLFFIQEMQE